MKKRIIGVAAAVIFITAVIAAVFYFYNRNTEDNTVEIKASSGEKIVYATIEEINGNDIEVTIVDEAIVEQITAASQKTEDAKSDRTRTDSAESGMSGMPGDGMPDMPGGGMPDMSGVGMPDMPGGGMPDMSGGGMPDMSEEEMPQTSEDKSRERMQGEMPEREKQPGNKDEVSETAAYRIPVGTNVVTKLGAVTTFSHLEEGDTIAILIEEKSGGILKIWMVL